MKYKSDWKKFCKSENADWNEIQMCSSEILQIWKGEIFEHISHDLRLRDSRPCWHVSWFWFLLEEVGCVQVHAHSWLQGQVHNQHYSRSQNDSIQSGWDSVRWGFNEDMPLSFSHLAIMVLDANFINIPTRQLASSSSFFFTRRMQRRLTTVWWRWGAALLTSMKTSATCPSLPSNH